FMVLGMNWDYVPIGQNYSYSLWTQPDHVIEAALEREMSLLSAMGVNTIRQYAGIPSRWISYIHERWGIWTILNHPMARYGFNVGGVWVANTDYSDPRLRQAVKDEIVAMVEEFRDTPGVLLWLIGNENNYGLTWTSFEIEALPQGEQQAARARYLYTLYDEVTRAIQALDSRPVAIANGDLQYIDLIAEECRTLDILGTNCYRGISARDLFEVARDKLGIPVLFTEFGADAFDARRMREDQAMQCRYLVGQWQEIYEQSAGKGRVGNCIGGLTFQWSDGWWKYLQEERLDIHDTNASWPNGGYVEDFVEGDNNMNEEWWGVCAKGRPDHRGLYQLYPRAAWYALRDAYRLDPYAPATDLGAIRDHFGAISAAGTELLARGDRAALQAESVLARVSGLRMEFETYSTGGTRTSTPESGTGPGQPAFQGFDRKQSYWVDLEAQPSRNVIGTLSLNVLGEVPENAIDEIFYENRGRPATFVAGGDSIEIDGLERVKVYSAGVTWDDRNFQLDGFFRTGHFHWGYQGDFFGLYREANYGENLDIYNGEAPLGLEITGKRHLEGFAVAYGPELWWGANPAVLARYGRDLGRFTATAVVHEDVSEQSEVNTSIAVPLPKTRKAAVGVATNVGPIGIELGGLWSGDTKVGDTFDVVEGDVSGYTVLRDTVRTEDTFGAKGKVMLQYGRWNWYAQAAYMGIVADGGPTQTVTYTGWHLKDSGTGNQTNFLTGLAVNLGD
ncbi:MAG TPA: glycoside hydrolase family 2 TIM barrel-domain containing protein, partial [bacterium]|nr:glycoside hydrolase family 2 TIM barrel-domain containing protein [bacterium]